MWLNKYWSILLDFILIQTKNNKLLLQWTGWEKMLRKSKKKSYRTLAVLPSFSQNIERFEKQDLKGIQSILCLSYFIATVHTSKIWCCLVSYITEINIFFQNGIFFFKIASSVCCMLRNNLHKHCLLTACSGLVHRSKPGQLLYLVHQL